MKSIKLIGLFLLCLVCLNFKADDKPLKVIIDAGHGGEDIGAVMNKVSEKEIVYAISQKIKALENKNIEILLLRNHDQFIPLKERVEKINALAPDLVVSLHIDNSKLTSTSSTRAYVHKNKHLKRSFYYAKKLLKQLDNKTPKIDFASFYILRESDYPAFNLTLGNFNSKEDVTFLSSEFGQNYIAEQILKGLQ